MRLFLLVLAAAFALFSSAIAVPAMTNVDNISTPNQVLSSESEGRRLRAHKSTDDDTEERLNLEKLNKLMSSETFRTNKFDEWIGKRYTDTKIYNKLNVDDNPSYERIFRYYQNYIQKWAPNLISP